MIFKKMFESWRMFLSEESDNIPQHIKSYEEWMDWYWTKLAKQVGFGPERFAAVPAGLIKNKEWIGSWFRFPRLETPDPKVRRVLYKNLKFIMLTPDLDFIDSEYNKIEVENDDRLISINQNYRIPNYDVIMSDFEISASRSIDIPSIDRDGFRNVEFKVNDNNQIIFSFDLGTKRLASIQIFNNFEDRRDNIIYFFPKFETQKIVVMYKKPRVDVHYDLNGRCIWKSTNKYG